jgi:hypothetical protein
LIGSDALSSGAVKRGDQGFGCGLIGSEGEFGGRKRGDHGLGCGATDGSPDVGVPANCGDQGESPAAGAGRDGLVATFIFVLTVWRGKVLGSSGLKGVRVPGKKLVRLRKKFVPLRKKFVRFRKMLVLNAAFVAPGGMG